MIYLDNSATSKYKPKKTIKALKNTITKLSTNPGRGSHKLSIKASLKILETRESISEFFNLGKPNNVIFTSGCTESLNMAILGTAKSNGHIIVSTFEHNSVLRVLNHLKQTKNITYTIIKPKNEKINISEIQGSIKPNTYLVIINHISNVTGSEQDINKIGAFCKVNKLLFMVDAAQSAGHVKIDMQKNKINLLCAACHKGLLGPQGLGLLLINDCDVRPTKFGGTGINSENLEMPNEYPEKLECGTLPVELILSTFESIKFLNKNFDKVNNKIKKLSLILYNHLKNNNKVILYTTNYKSGVFAFNLKHTPPNILANYLNKHDICIRAGLHCAPYAHKYINTFPDGCIRASIGYNNSKRNIKKFIKVLNSFNE